MKWLVFNLKWLSNLSAVKIGCIKGIFLLLNVFLKDQYVLELIQVLDNLLAII